MVAIIWTFRQGYMAFFALSLRASIVLRRPVFTVTATARVHSHCDPTSIRTQLAFSSPNPLICPPISSSLILSPFQAFEAVDTDGDNIVSVEETRRLLNHLAGGNVAMTLLEAATVSLPYRNTYPPGVASVYKAKLGIEYQRLTHYLGLAVRRRCVTEG